MYFLSAPILSLVLTKSSLYADLFRATSLMVFSVSFSTIMDGLLQGVKEFYWLALLRLLGQVARILIYLEMLFAGYGPISVVVGWVIFRVCISLSSLPPILRNISLRERRYSFRPITRLKPLHCREDLSRLHL